MRIQNVRSFVAVASAAALLAGGAARAVDGVIEISDAAIIAAGGYPFVIPGPGSYVLTGNLTPPAGTDALMLPVGDVEIDLNGFALIGAGGGVGDGIAAVGVPGLTVKDGTILGFDGAGISAGPELKVFKTRITGNGAGILGGFLCIVVENVISANTGIGLEAQQCKIENNVITGNGDIGLLADKSVIVHNEITGNGFLGPLGGGILSLANTIQENVILGNANFGISDTPGAPPGPVPAPPGVPFPFALPGPPPNNIMKNVIDSLGVLASMGIFMAGSALITDNTVTNHDFDGIVCSIACTLRGNQVNANNTSGASNGGVTAGPGSTVNDNSIGFNTGIGLVLDPTAGWANNTLVANTVQDVSVDVPPTGPPHPTSGFANLCSGAVGPVPGPGPGTCP
jgi:hypothetical protein